MGLLWALSFPREAVAARGGGSSKGPTALAAPAAAPNDFSDLAAWLEYKARAQRHALPEPARLFYRQSILVHQSGNQEEAIRLMRGAAELDPTFAEPRFQLASWFLVRDPGQALVQSASLLEVARQNFVVQLGLVTNTATVLAQTLFLTLLITGFLVVILRNGELRHPLQERLSQRIGAQAARIWPWVLLAIPFVAGLGFTLPTIFLLAMLWPLTRWGERVVLATLVALLVSAPWLVGQIDRLASPLRTDSEPFFGVVALQSQPYSAEEHARIASLAGAHPNQPFLQFGLAWTARQGGDLGTAAQAYRRTLELWPQNDQALNNLGNVLAIQGREDEAMEHYRQAIAANPANAAAYFNLSQAYTRRFDYHAANDALSHASALNFEMLRAYQSQTRSDGPLPLVDQWIAPRIFWHALLNQPPVAGQPAAIPPAWRGHIECSGGRFTVALIVALVLGLALGIAQHRALPLRRCGNCDRVLCRRCTERRREVALCHSCAEAQASTHAAEFARVLLLEHRKKEQRVGRIARTALAALIPGFGPLCFRRTFTAFTLVLSAVTLLNTAPSAMPYSFEPRLDAPEVGSSLLLMILPWVAIYASSIIGYFIDLQRYEARAAAPPKMNRKHSGPQSRQISAAA